MNLAPGKVNTYENENEYCLGGLTQAEDEFHCFKKWSRDHDDLDEEVEKYAQERDCQVN